LSDYKKCTKCSEEKEIFEFHKGRSRCKECEYWLKKKYRERNAEKIRKRKKEYSIKNKEKIKRKGKIYHRKNKKRISLRNRLSKENNPALYLYFTAKSRARRNNIKFEIELNDIIDILPKDNICPLLNIEILINKNHSKYNSMNLDRIIPEFGYVRDNIVIISKKANISKNNATIDEYEKIVNNMENIVNNKMKIIGGGIIDYISFSKYSSNKKSDSKIKNIKFNLDKDYLKSIYPKNNRCPLLDIEFKKGDKGVCSNSPTLDRIVPEKGYVKGNVIFISAKANRVKNNLTLDEMKLLLKNWKRLFNK
jgi:hypothetical protein